MLSKQDSEIKTIELTIKFIFFKKHLTQEDVANGNRLINKWKTLTGWVERTEHPILFK